MSKTDNGEGEDEDEDAVSKASFSGVVRRHSLSPATTVSVFSLPSVLIVAVAVDDDDEEDVIDFVVVAAGCCVD